MRGSTQIITGGSATGGSATFATLGGVPGDNTALAAALVAKLDAAGGTMTGALSFGASDDVKIGRGGAAATLQMGVDHETTATRQTIKAHNVTTGTGANLVLAGGTGSVAGGEVILAASDTTGAPVPIVSAMPGSKIAFFGTGGSVQINPGISGEMHATGSGTAVDDSSTFGGYTIGQIVAGLRALGLFN